VNPQEVNATTEKIKENEGDCVKNPNPNQCPNRFIFSWRTNTDGYKKHPDTPNDN